jgi:hypothetical protein
VLGVATGNLMENSEKVAQGQIPNGSEEHRRRWIGKLVVVRQTMVLI